MPETAEPAPSKRDLQREARRREILDAALRVFAGKGYHQASVSDVAAGAGVSQGTIYLYFASKEALLAELMDEVFGEMMAPFVDVLGRAELPAVERLRQLLRALLAMARADTEKVRLIVALWSQPEVFGAGAAGGQAGRAYAEQVLGPFQAVLEEAMAAGEIPAGDAEALALVLGATLDGLMLYSTMLPASLVSDARLEAVFIERFLLTRGREPEGEPR